MHACARVKIKTTQNITEWPSINSKITSHVNKCSGSFFCLHHCLPHTPHPTSPPPTCTRTCNNSTLAESLGNCLGFIFEYLLLTQMFIWRFQQSLTLPVKQDETARGGKKLNHDQQVFTDGIKPSPNIYIVEIWRHTGSDTVRLRRRPDLGPWWGKQTPASVGRCSDRSPYRS